MADENCNCGMELPEKFVEKLVQLPETGMGYQVVDIYLKDGRVFVAIVLNCEFVTRVKGCDDIPFLVDDIEDIRISRERF